MDLSSEDSVILNLFSGERETQIQGALDLSNRNKIRIVKAGALPVLLQLLVLDSETKLDLVELALTFLLVLSSCSSSVQAKADAISTLHNLSTHNQIIPLIVSSSALYTLLQLINFSEKSSELTEKASALLEKMVSFSPGLLQMSVDGTWRAKEMATELLLLLRDCSNHSLRTKKPKHEVIEQIMQKIDEQGEKIPETPPMSSASASSLFFAFLISACPSWNGFVLNATSKCLNNLALHCLDPEESS